MPEFSEERLAGLIALLSPPPQGWVRAATELPRARAAIDGLIARASADKQIRDSILADLESALHGAGIEPRPQLLENLRARLSGPD